MTANPSARVASAESAEAVAATRRWIERVVIGLNLCPFARAPFVHERVRLTVSAAREADDLLDDLRRELCELRDSDPQVCETTLLIHPYVLQDFFAYNDFLDRADHAIESLGLESDFQIASFHPAYQFADVDFDAVENYTNRSPYPMLHLLRESSVARAIAKMADTDDIYRRNIQMLRELGISGLRAVIDAGSP